jgi:2-polyprenyl-3-methyl-5-hydroxy-6-metoxy-1,4-benzoquinol methylase
MAAGADDDARRRLAIAGTMINLADAIEAGEARHLKGISTRAAVESLDASVRSAMHEADRNLTYQQQLERKGRAPEPDDIRNAKIYRPSWGTGGANKSQLIDKLQGKRGAKPLIERLRASGGPDGAMVKDLKKYLDEKDISYGLGWWNVEQVKKVDRLARLGINTDHELRLALAEYLTFRDGVKKEDPIKAAERALVGKKVGIDFFPTPKPLAAKMAEMAGVKPGMSVLEPSAGNGHLADAARDAGATVDAIEISDTLRNVLSAKGHNIAAHDFDTFEPGKQYDAVIMNPPFSDRKDATHIMRAFDMLKPGGKLVAIAGEGVFFGTDQRATAFRSWLDEHGADVEKLPANTFKGSDLPSQTGANARMLVIAKPAEAAAAPVDAGPKDGERNADGLVFKDGRWHREETPAADDGRVTIASALHDGTTVRDGKGNLYRVHYQRNHLVIAHPIVDGKAQVNADSTVRFWTSADMPPAGDNDRQDPIYPVKSDEKPAAPARPMDHGELNVPLSKRGDIDAQIDRYKKEQAAEAEKKRKESSAENKSDKVRAKELFDEVGAAMLAKHGAHFGEKKLRETMDSLMKWEPKKFIKLAEAFKKEQAGEAPAAAAPVAESTPLDRIKQHLDNDDADAAFAELSKMKFDELKATGWFGTGHGQTKAQFLADVKQRVARMTKTGRAARAHAANLTEIAERHQKAKHYRELSSGAMAMGGYDESKRDDKLVAEYEQKMRDARAEFAAASKDAGVPAEIAAKYPEMVAEAAPVAESDLESVGLLREFAGHWQYKFGVDGRWMTANAKADAVERATAAYHKTPEDQRLTRAQRDEKADAEEFEQSHRAYGSRSLPELRDKFEQMGGEIASNRKAGEREFNGGGRRTSAAVSNEAARNIAEERMRLGRYIAKREAMEGPKDGDRNADGLVFRDGRWHREESPAVEQAAPVESAKEHRYAMVNRPVGISTAPKDFVRTEDRPAVGEVHHDYARNGVAVYNRKLSDAETKQYEMAHMADGDDRAEYADDVAEALKRYAEPYIEMADNEPDQFRQTVADRLKSKAKGYVPSVGDMGQFADMVRDKLRAYAAPAAAAAEPVVEPAMPAPTNPDVELAEDREDLADELARNPHSDKAKALVKKVAERVAAREEPVEADVDRPSSENYRYADTGHIGGSRKERAALEVITRAKKEGARVFATAIDWDELEQNPREAKTLITKSNLFGEVDWPALRDGGMDPGAGFLVDRIYAAIGQEPSAESAQARKDYAIGLQSLRDRLEGCKTPADVTGVLDSLREEYEGTMLTAEEAEQYEAHGDASMALFHESKALRDETDKLYAEMGNIRAEMYGVEREVENRKRRGWAPKPDLDAKLADLKKRHDAADKKWGDALQKNKPRHDEIDAARSEFGRKREVLKLMAKVRNQTENPLHRAWNLMGDRFLGVIRYRSYKGSDAFANHVAAAKVGRIGWDWMEKEAKRAPRISKESARFQLKVADSFERVGGRTVAPDSTMALKEMFGLRDVQSGNWVLRDVASAKFHTEQCAGAFADLADLMGADDAHVSLNGRLAMAFGARGNGAAGGGAAKAHYEPVHRVINLTKLGGGGSLAHEWFHALDNMAKEAEGMGESGAHDFITENPHLLPPGELRDATIALRSAMLDGTHQHTELVSYTASDVRMAKHNLNGTYPNAMARSIRDAGTVHAAFKAIDAMYPDDKTLTKKRKNTRDVWRLIAAAHFGGNPEGGAVEVKHGKGMSSFAMEAAKLDTGSKEYWQLTHEMSARAFQSWVEDRLADKGRRNDYLSSLADNRYHVDPLTGVQFKPYPEGDERVKINAAFDRFVAAVKQADTLAKALELV